MNDFLRITIENKECYIKKDEIEYFSFDIEKCVLQINTRNNKYSFSTNRNLHCALPCDKNLINNEKCEWDLKNLLKMDYVYIANPVYEIGVYKEDIEKGLVTYFIYDNKGENNEQ